MRRFAIAVLASLSLAAPALAQDGTPVRIVEDVPALHIPKRVGAGATPSGLPVPRYVSLKRGKTNCRIGPSTDHRVAYEYRRRGMPLVVVAETEQWRRVRDVNGDACWIKGSLLSGVRGAVALSDVELRRKPRADARVRAVAERGAVGELGECREGWCEFRAGEPNSRIRGWVRARELWGALPL